MEEVWKFLIVIFTSSLKFLVAVPLVRASNLSFWEAVLSMSFGGCLGVTVFLFLTDSIVFLYQWIKKKIVGEQPNKPPKKIFSPTSRFIVRMIKSYGLIGLAIITPSLISIPIGTFIAERLNKKLIHNTKKVWLYLCISVIAWAFLLNGISYLF